MTPARCAINLMLVRSNPQPMNSAEAAPVMSFLTSADDRRLRSVLVATPS
ncbi:hypothetical protein [Nocardia sp. NPDC047038]